MGKRFKKAPRKMLNIANPQDFGVWELWGTLCVI
jgi:hypothetical protein